VAVLLVRLERLPVGPTLGEVRATLIGHHDSSLREFHALGRYLVRNGKACGAVRACCAAEEMGEMFRSLCLPGTNGHTVQAVGQRRQIIRVAGADTRPAPACGSRRAERPRCPGGSGTERTHRHSACFTAGESSRCPVPFSGPRAVGTSRGTSDAERADIQRRDHTRHVGPPPTQAVLADGHLAPAQTLVGSAANSSSRPSTQGE